jgi:hypothetical protein
MYSALHIYRTWQHAIIYLLLPRRMCMQLSLPMHVYHSQIEPTSLSIGGPRELAEPHRAADAVNGVADRDHQSSHANGTVCPATLKN